MAEEQSDFLDHDPADLDWQNASGDIKSLLDQVDRDVVGWMPQVGSKVYGKVIDMQTATSDFGEYPLITIETPSGRLVGVHCFHTVLKNEIERKQKAGRLVVGDEIAVLYKGQGEAKGSNNAPEMYRVAVNHFEQ